MAEQIPPAWRQEVPSDGNDVQADARGNGRTAHGDMPNPSTNSSPAGGRPESADAPLRGGDGGSEGWRGAAARRQAYAAIDLGTNNCRLLIARPSGENFIVVDAFSRVVRLGEGLAQTGRLSQQAMDRALSALQICSDKLRRRNVHLARSVATEACRRAENGYDFIDRVKRETGIVLDIISAREEARLAVLGCHILLEPGIGPAMIFDIGGGSTELVLIESGPTVPRILDWKSVPWGVVSLTETCGPEGDGLPARVARYAEMRRLVAESFADFAERIGPARESATLEHELRLLGTSGTVTTLASLHLELPQYDRRAVDGLNVPAEAMRDISTRLSSMSPEERRELPCIGRERADLVVAGCAILETILDLWPAARLGVADRGIREGILRSLMAGGSTSARIGAALRARQGGTA
ncbi:MAG: Ppx/GppA family phosphatase [Sphingomonadales bacterium]|nr:Ppx/GppA family phosphatase [Sphingomonadales bacterium]